MALHRRAGRAGVVLAVTVLSVASSVALTALLVVPLLTEEDTRNGMLEVSLGIAVAVPAVVAPLVTLVLTSLIVRLDEAYGQVWTLSTRDPLTHAYNRRGLFSEAERRLAHPGGDQLLVGMVDLNDFKRINDTHGHTAGDEVLRCTATTLSGLVGRTGAIGRIGGDEFAFIAAGTPAEVEFLTTAGEDVLRRFPGDHPEWTHPRLSGRGAGHRGCGRGVCRCPGPRRPRPVRPDRRRPVTAGARDDDAWSWSASVRYSFPG